MLDPHQRRIALPAVSLLACLACLCAPASSTGSKSIVNTALRVCYDDQRVWKLANQRVSVFNAWWGRLNAAVAFEETFAMGTRHMVRWRLVNGSRQCERFGQVDVFVDANEYRVISDSEFRVFFDDLGSSLVMSGNLRLGKNLLESDGLTYEYTASIGAFCRYFRSSRG